MGRPTVRLCTRAVGNHCLGNGITLMCVCHHREPSTGHLLCGTLSPDRSRYPDQIGRCLCVAPPIGVELVIGLGQGSHRRTRCDVSCLRDARRWPNRCLHAVAITTILRHVFLRANPPEKKRYGTTSTPSHHSHRRPPPRQRQNEATFVPYRLLMCVRMRLGFPASSPARME